MDAWARSYRTGETCELSGIYQSDCPCECRILLVAGDSFPLCTKCRVQVGWRYRESGAA